MSQLSDVVWFYIKVPGRQAYVIAYSVSGYTT